MTIQRTWSRPGDAFYDEDNAHVLTPLRYGVEGLHVDAPPTALAKGLREWGWDTVPVRTRTRDGRRVITVGSEDKPMARAAFVLGFPLVINPAERLDVVKEVANRISPLNPAQCAAPFFDLMNMGGDPSGMTDPFDMSSISAASSPDKGNKSTGMASTTAPSFGSVANDLAVGGIAHRADKAIKENAEEMKAQYDRLQEWCDARFVVVEQGLKDQQQAATDLSNQIAGVATAQTQSDQRAIDAASRHEQAQSQIMQMLNGLTRLAGGPDIAQNGVGTAVPAGPAGPYGPTPMQPSNPGAAPY